MINRFGKSIAIAAALSLTATPAFARHYSDWGRHDDRIDAGDVLTGILIIGGLAAIASAASKSDRDRRARDYERNRDYRDSSTTDGNYGDESRPEWREDGAERDYSPQPQGTRNSDRAVDQCVAETERGEARVETVDAVNREGAGWRITGRMRGGADFSCSVDGDGRVSTAV